MKFTSKSLLEIVIVSNQVLDRAMPLLVPLGVVLGVLFPGVFLKVRVVTPLIFGTITLTGALKLRVQDLGKTIRSPLPLFLFFFNAHVLMPLLVFFISGLIFKNDPNTVSGYVLIYSVPTAVSGFIWVSIFKGDPALALALILLDTILAPLVVPGTVRLLLGTSIALNTAGLVFSLIYMVVFPTILGVTLNETSHGKIPSVIGPWLNPVSKICLMLVIASNSAAVAPQIHLNDPHVWKIFAVCAVFSILGFLCGRLTGIVGKLSHDKQISLLYASALRNTSAAMTLGIDFFPTAAALPSALGIIIQQSIAAIMGRLLLGRKKK